MLLVASTNHKAVRFNSRLFMNLPHKVQSNYAELEPNALAGAEG